MRNIIQAAVNNKVKKIVVTSSIFTVSGSRWKKHENTYSESDVAPFEGTKDPYTKS